MHINILNLDIDNSLYDKFNQYLELLLFWQKSINLISNDTIKDAMYRHFYDSLQLIQELKQIQNKKNWQNTILNIFDLGSGAGFPGLVLAIVDKKNKYYLIESNSKKVFFLKEVIRCLDLKNVEVINKRIEDFAKDEIKANIVTSRGLTKLSDLFYFCKQIGIKDVVGLFLKGKNYLQEINDLKMNNKNIVFNISIKDSLVNNEGKIIIIE